MLVEPTSRTTRRIAMRLAGCCCCALISGLRPRLAFTAEPSRPALRLPKEILGIPIPDSKIASDAADIAYAESPPFLFNHCMRVFVFSSLLAKNANWDWDGEVVFVASALHDVGLFEKFDDAKKTFEAAGADFARAFAVAREFSEHRADMVHKGIALHTTPGTSDDPVHEVGMIQIGAGLDVFGFGCEKIPPAVRTKVLDAFPRLAFKRSFRDALAAYKERHPGPAGEGDWITGFLLGGGGDSSCWPE